MFSVIIPTLQLAPQLPALVDSLVDHPLVLEVIIINNATAPLHWESPRIRVLQQSENIYVNPAWNLGARGARGDLLAIVNDDLTFDTKLLNVAAERLRRRSGGIIGPSTATFTGPTTQHTPTFSRVFDRPFGFGTLMLMRTADYVPIPETMLISGGDDWLFYSQRRPNWVVDGVTIETEMSVSSGRGEFSPVQSADLAARAQWFDGLRARHRRHNLLPRAGSAVRRAAGRFRSS